MAPVAGEFRWVLGKFLDRTPPEPMLLSESRPQCAALGSGANRPCTDKAMTNQARRMARCSLPRVRKRSMSAQRAPSSAFLVDRQDGP